MKSAILLFINYYLPGYKAGGPVQTIANMVNAIGDKYTFYIVASDRDVEGECAYPNIRHNEWMNLGNSFVHYLSPGEQNFHTFRKIIQETDFDIIYCQSFFNPRFTILPLIAFFFTKKRSKPVLLAPRGEFAPGALAHKKMKKKLYLFFFRLVFVHLLNYTFQCSSGDEQNDVSHYFGKKVPQLIALDFNSQDHVDEHFKEKTGEGPLKVVLIARIDIQKNIDLAIDLVKKTAIPIVFDIYGNVHDRQYAQKCSDLLKDLPDHVHISFKGELPHNIVLQTLQNYDLFFLPTKNENFCHSIHEALLAGVPVLISDKTPWHELEARNAGWEIPLTNPDLFAVAIEKFHSLSSKQRIQMRQAALKYGIDVSNNQQTLCDNIQMINSLLHG